MAPDGITDFGIALAKHCNHGRPQKFFQGGQSRPFADPLQVVDDATQMDVSTPQKNANCYGNSCIQCFPSKKILHEVNVCFSEHVYFKTQLAEF